MMNINDHRSYFEDVAKSEAQFLDCFSSSLFDWSCAWGFTSSSTVLHFISSLSLIPFTSSIVLT
jgi:hypothetical protein